MKVIVGCVIAATLSVSSVIFANTHYNPPERISCTLDNAHQLICQGFDHQYLVEDTDTSNLKDMNNEVFDFAAGKAYLSPTQDSSTIFFTYKNAQFPSIKLRTVIPTTLPDFANGDWKKISDDIYTCDTSYMQCPFVNFSGK